MTGCAGVAASPTSWLPGTARQRLPIAVHQLRGIGHVVFDIGAVDRHIAGMDHEIRALRGDPSASGAQLSAKCGLLRLKCVSEIWITRITRSHR